MGDKSMPPMAGMTPLNRLRAGSTMVASGETMACGVCGIHVKIKRATTHVLYSDRNDVRPDVRAISAALFPGISAANECYTKKKEGKGGKKVK